MPYLLQFCDIIDSIATLTTDESAFGPLPVGDKSLGVEALVRIKVVILSVYEFTTQNFAYSYVRLSEEVHHYVGFESFQRLPTSRGNANTIQNSTHRLMA